MKQFLSESSRSVGAGRSVTWAVIKRVAVVELGVNSVSEQNYLVFIAIYLALDWSPVNLVLLFVSICIGLIYLRLSAKFIAAPKSNFY